MKLDLLVEVSQVDLEKTRRLNFGCLSWLTSPSLVCLKHILSILSSQNHVIELTALTIILLAHKERVRSVNKMSVSV